MQRQQGFTLLELITTLAIVMILATVAVPGLQSITSSSRQASSVNEIVSAIHLARSTAVTRNLRTTICASKDGLSCNGAGWEDGVIVFTDVDSDQVVDADDNVVSASSKIEHVTISASAFGTALTYRANGRPLAPAAGSSVGQFDVCDNRGSEYARAIVIDISGRPRVAANSKTKTDAEFTPTSSVACE